MRLGLILGLAISMVAAPVFASEPSPAKSMDELLNRVKVGWRADIEKAQTREANFKKARAEQRRLLARPYSSKKIWSRPASTREPVSVKRK